MDKENTNKGNTFFSKFGLEEVVVFISNGIKIPAKIKKVSFSFHGGITYDISLISREKDGTYRYSVPIGGITASSLSSIDEN